MTQAIIFDFDGVVLDSEKIKDNGFRDLFTGFPAEAVDCLIAYHKDNGGLSRFVKIRYMFETILRQPVSDEIIMRYAAEFSDMMLRELTNPIYLIPETLDFIRKYYKKLPMHVASGTEQNELRTLVKELGLAEYFTYVYGSPADKTANVNTIISDGGYDRDRVILIGDSKNDMAAARDNGIIFCGYNNEKLMKVSDYYITDYGDFADKYII